MAFTYFQFCTTIAGGASQEELDAAYTEGAASVTPEDGIGQADLDALAESYAGWCASDIDNDGVCDVDEVSGCMDASSCNYVSSAEFDDGSCDYVSCLDDCGVPNGDNSTCLDECGVLNGDNSCLDECGVVNGDNSCLDECGVPNGDNSTCLDECGVLNGDNSTCLDECGVPNGDGSSCVFESCGDQIGHEKHAYSTVLIGEQCWFSENCRYLPEVSPSSEGSSTEPYYYVYGYEDSNVLVAQATTNYETYGVLYNWPAVMAEGICPSGWHIPTDGEFTQLTDFLGGQSVAGGKMKEAGYDHWYSPNTGATNSSGWTGLPGGYRGVYFSNDRYYGYWWSASESGSTSWLRRMLNDNDDVYRYVSGSRSYGFSARCVRD